MRHRWWVLLSALLITLALAPVGAAATQTGSTGLARIPTSDVLPAGEVRVGVWSDGPRMGGSVGYGILPGVEVALYQAGPGWGASLKGQVLEETATSPALATGFEGGAVYAVASKQLRPLLRAHFGYGTGHMGGLFGGLSYLLNPVVVSNSNGGMTPPRVTLFAEADRDGMSVGTQMTFSQNLDLHLAWVHFDHVVAGMTWQFRFD